MSTQPMPFVTPEEYLQAERDADYKSEYVSGQIWAMSGASITHNVLAANLTIAIGSALRGTPCQVLGSDMRVYVSENRTYVYPDLSVVCGEHQYADDKRDNLLNPTVIIEILSPSTAHYDRTVKFVKYRRLPSLREYVLVHQDAPHLEYFALVCDIWTSGACHGLYSTLELESIGVTVKLADIYERITFPTDENNP